MHQRTWLSLLTFPLVAAFSAPVIATKASPPARVEPANGVQDPLAGLSDIQDVLAQIRENYVDVPDMGKVITGGIEATLERVHPLNAYLSPEDLQLPDPGPAETGIRVIKRTIYAYVQAVVPGSPADKAGIQAGDVIRKVDGDSIGPMSPWTLDRRLRGAPDSQVTILRYVASNQELKKTTLKRERLAFVPSVARPGARGTRVIVSDLETGRAEDLRRTLAGLDHKLPLVLDLRTCYGGTLDEAGRVAGLFAASGPLGTVEETGKTPVPLAFESALVLPFPKVVLLLGTGTSGAGEVLASALKKQAFPTFGERTAALGVERTRFDLRQGGAILVVNKRWIGAGGEKLGYGGEKIDKAASQNYGVAPEHPLKGLKPEEDPMARILDILDSKAPQTSKLLPALGVKEAWLDLVLRSRPPVRWMA
jgi:carboxyl-terminal processing protease